MVRREGSDRLDARVREVDLWIRISDGERFFQKISLYKAFREFFQTYTASHIICK
jgi:hypothetical protein